jgi:hypothetical protein
MTHALDEFFRRYIRNLLEFLQQQGSPPDDSGTSTEH